MDGLNMDWIVVFNRHMEEQIDSFRDIETARLVYSTEKRHTLFCTQLPGAEILNTPRGITSTLPPRWLVSLWWTLLEKTHLTVGIPTRSFKESRAPKLATWEVKAPGEAPSCKVWLRLPTSDRVGRLPAPSPPKGPPRRRRGGEFLSLAPGPRVGCRWAREGEAAPPAWTVQPHLTLLHYGSPWPPPALLGICAAVVGSWWCKGRSSTSSPRPWLPSWITILHHHWINRGGRLSQSTECMGMGLEPKASVRNVSVWTMVPLLLGNAATDCIRHGGRTGVSLSRTLTLSVLFWILQLVYFQIGSRFVFGDHLRDIRQW